MKKKMEHDMKLGRVIQGLCRDGHVGASLSGTEPRGILLNL